MFDDLYKPLPDVAGYLKRIGFTDDIQNINVNTLEALTRAHLLAVPFENLDVYDFGRDIQLGIPDLFDKIVIKNRGGYCFELNGLFMSLLQGLGFECSAIAARVLWMSDYLHPISHRATIVTIGGLRYFCDVGFGGPSPGVMCLDEPGYQEIGGKSFLFERMEHSTIMFSLSEGVKVPLLMFYEIPFEPVDFIVMNEYTSKNAGSFFKSKRVVNLRTADGSLSIDSNILRRHRGEYCEETLLNSHDEIIGALEKHFGIHADGPLKL